MMNPIRFTRCAVFSLLFMICATVQAASDFTIESLGPGYGCVLTWSATNATLETSSAVTGPWAPIMEASSPYYVDPAEARRFYRLNFGHLSASPPVGTNDHYLTTHDQALAVASPGVLVNDFSPNGLLLSAALNSPPLNGALSLELDGGFLYTPNPGFVGSDAFTYTSSDGVRVSAPVTVFISVTNSPPLAQPDAYAVHQDQALLVDAPGVQGNDSDADGDPLTTTMVASPTNGVLQLNSDGSFIYTPNAGFSGADSFSYLDNDGLTNGNIAVVTLTIHAVNTPPSAANQSYVLAQDSTLTVPAPGLLSGASDAENDALTIVLVAGPTNGSLQSLSLNGAFQYLPAPGFAGFDGFTFQVSDGSTNSPTANVAITVTNSRPLAANYTYYLHSGGILQVPPSGVLLNDQDPNRDPLVAVLASNPAHGSLALNSDGSFWYTNTDLSFVGADSFNYLAADAFGTSTSAPATVTLWITNRPPVAVADSYGAHANMALTVAAPGVLANDSDPDEDSLTAVPGSGPSHGLLTLNSDGSFVYTPMAGYSGPDSFTYMANDGVASSSAATVSLNVHATNSPPLSGPTEYTIRPGETLFATNLDATVLDSDMDTDGDVLTANLVSPPANGTLSFSTNGTFTYNPNPGFVGDDGFTYLPFDGLTAGSNTMVTIHVANVAPVANPDYYCIHFNSSVTVGAPGVLENDTDDDLDELTADLVSGPANGSLQLSADGSFVYTANTAFLGTDSFTYTADDGFTVSAPTTVTINVTDTAPVAQSAIYDTITNATLTVPAPGVVGQGYDDDGDPLFATLVFPTTNGVLNLSSNGAFTYTPSPGFVGQDLFSFAVNDGMFPSGQGYIFINVSTNGITPVETDAPKISSSVTLQRLIFDNVYQTPNRLMPAGFAPTGRAVYSDWGQRVAERGLLPVESLETGYWTYSWRWTTANGQIGPNLGEVAENAAAGNPGRTAQFGYPYIYKQGDKLAAKARLKFSNLPKGTMVTLTGDIYWGSPLAQIANALNLIAPGSVYVPIPGLRSARLTYPTAMTANGFSTCWGETPFVVADNPFPNLVGFMPMTIVWHYNTGGILPERVCGISRHTIYLTFDQTTNLRNYWTVVDDGCRASGLNAVPAGNGNQANFIKKIYTREFEDHDATRVDNAPLGYYSTMLQTANTPLGWQATAGGWNAAEYMTVPGLLKYGTGFNNAWAQLFLEVLQAQGLKDAAGAPVSTLRRVLPKRPQGALLTGTLAALGGAGPGRAFSTPYTPTGRRDLIYPSFSMNAGPLPALPGWRFTFDARTPMVAMGIIPTASTLVGQNGTTMVPKPAGAGAAPAAAAASGPPNWWYYGYIVSADTAAGTTYYDPAYGLTYSGLFDMRTKWLGGTGAGATGGKFRWLGKNPTGVAAIGKLPEFEVRKVGFFEDFLSFVSLSFTTPPGNIAAGLGQNVKVSLIKRSFGGPFGLIVADRGIQNATIRITYEYNAGRANPINPATAMTDGNGVATFNNVIINRGANGYALLAKATVVPAGAVVKPADITPVVSPLFNVTGP